MKKPTNMHSRIGKTDLFVPPVGFGAAHLGGIFDRVNSDQARATLLAAWDGGVRFFDTAPYYGRGLSEHRVGDFLIDQPRRDFVLTTKVGRVFHRPQNPTAFDLTPWGGGLKFEFEFDYTYDGVMKSYEQSLMRLGLETVDALLIHDPDQIAHGEHFSNRMQDLQSSGIKALEELKRTGEIKAIGMGLNRTESLETIAPLVDLDFLVVAMPYTLLDQSGLHAGLARCVENDISVIIGAPFASGILATGPRPGARYGYLPASKDILAKTGKIQDVCRSHGVSLAAAALQFTLAHPAVISVIPGGAKPEEVTQNISSSKARIPAELWEELKDSGLIEANAPVPI